MRGSGESRCDTRLISGRVGLGSQIRWQRRRQEIGIASRTMGELGIVEVDRFSQAPEVRD